MRDRSAARLPIDDDAGFSIVEVVLAMVIFVVMTVAVLAMLLSALGGARSNAQRVQAANIAGQQVEAVRALRAEAIPDGLTTPAISGTTIQGTTYTVRQSAAFLSGDGSVSLCRSGAGKPTFKRVTVTVTWPTMGGVAPVRSDTIVALGAGSQDLDKTLGIAAVLVRDSGQNPLDNVTVTLASAAPPATATTTTDADGCAVFVNRPTGNYTASVDQGGYVGFRGQQAESAPVGVDADRIGRTTINYDRAAALQVVLLPPTGYTPAPVAVPVTVDYAKYPTGTRVYQPCSEPLATAPLCTDDGTGMIRTVRGLFPGPDSYGAWAGACPSSRPTDPSSRATLVAAGTGRVEAPLAGVQITVSSASRTPAGRPVYAYPAETGCQSAPWQIATSSPGTVKAALPQGEWIFSLDGATTAGAPGSVRARPTTTQPVAVTLAAP